MKIDDNYAEIYIGVTERDDQTINLSLSVPVQVFPDRKAYVTRIAASFPDLEDQVVKYWKNIDLAQSTESIRASSRHMADAESHLDHIKSMLNGGTFDLGLSKDVTLFQALRDYVTGSRRFDCFFLFWIEESRPFIPWAALFEKYMKGCLRRDNLAVVHINKVGTAGSKQSQQFGLNDYVYRPLLPFRQIATALHWQFPAIKEGVELLNNNSNIDFLAVESSSQLLDFFFDDDTDLMHIGAHGFVVEDAANIRYRHSPRTDWQVFSVSELLSRSSNNTLTGPTIVFCNFCKGIDSTIRSQNFTDAFVTTGVDIIFSYPINISDKDASYVSMTFYDLIVNLDRENGEGVMLVHILRELQASFFRELRAGRIEDLTASRAPWNNIQVSANRNVQFDWRADEAV